MNKVVKKPRGTALVKKEAGLPMKVSPDGALDFQTLIAIAMKNDPPSVERLLAMNRDMKAERAREAYFDALAGFQSECPIVYKSKKVKGKKKDGEAEAPTKYSYAPIEDILAFQEAAGPTIKELLKKWGFSYTFKSHQSEDGKRYTAICYAHHREGHSEYTEFTVPTSFPEYMNLSGAQEQGASCTYADRYAFKNAFGIVTKGDDNDAPRNEDEQRRKPLKQPQETVPVEHEEVKPLSDYDKILALLKSVSTAPTGQLVSIFNPNEVIDYTHEANEEKDKPEELKRILADIVATGAKRHKAIKGTEAKKAT